MQLNAEAYPLFLLPKQIVVLGGWGGKSMMLKRKRICCSTRKGKHKQSYSRVPYPKLVNIG